MDGGHSAGRAFGDPANDATDLTRRANQPRIYLFGRAVQPFLKKYSAFQKQKLAVYPPPSRST
jgi:hypothetical protein